MKVTATMAAGIDRKIRTFGFDPSKLSDHSMDDLMELRRRVVEAHSNPIGEDNLVRENGRLTIYLIDKKGRHKLDQIGWAVYHKQRQAKT